MKTAEPLAGPRERLLEAALRMLEAGGPEALQARKLAAEIGASTMAVYTHFGGMPELIEAIVREGFARFGAALVVSTETDDPMADFLDQGMAYREFARRHPQLYRLMFGLAGTDKLRSYQQDMTVTGTPGALPEGQTSFGHLVTALDRLQSAGLIREQDTVAAAGQVWSMTHGYVSLEMTGVFGHEDHGLAQVLAPLAVNLLVGLGADRAHVERSMVAAFSARGGA